MRQRPIFHQNNHPLNRNHILILLLLCALFACQEKSNEKLPKLGHYDVEGGDTLFHTISTFQFVDQDSTVITNDDLSDYVYVSDFFFMHCPTICPKVKKQMLRLYDHYEDNSNIKFVSHTLDPKRDTPSRLKQYASNLGVAHDKWLFLTGSKDDIYTIKDDYFIAAVEDPDSPGGISHSGKIILVDKQGHVRSFAEGTDPKEVDEFFHDIDRLLIEYEE